MPTLCSIGMEVPIGILGCFVEKIVLGTAGLGIILMLKVSSFLFFLRRSFTLVAQAGV